MDIHAEIDFREPYEIDVVFKTLDQSNPAEPKLEEYKSSLFITWDCIDAIQEYPTPDTWTGDRAGPKFYLHLSRGLGSQVVLGSYAIMKEVWRQYLQFEREQHERNFGS